MLMIIKYYLYLVQKIACIIFDLEENVTLVDSFHLFENLFANGMFLPLLYPYLGFCPFFPFKVDLINWRL